MTTPNQPAPPGAYQIGGGSDRFSQDQTETHAKSLWEVPAVNLGNMLDLLRKYLLEIPLEALQGMLSFIPDFIGDITSAVDIVGHIVGTLVDNATVALTKIVNQIMDIFNGLVVTPINAAIQGVKDWWAQLLGFQENTNTTQINLQNFSITNLTSGARNALWECRYPIGDVSFPEFMHFIMGMSGVTEAQSAGTAHTHNLDPNNAAAGLVFAVLPQNCTHGSYVGVRYTTVYDTVGAVVSKQSGAVNNVFLEVFRENVDTSLIRIFSGNVASQISSAAGDYYVELPVSGGIIAAAGEKYLVRLRNSSSTATQLGMPSTTQAAYAVDRSFATVGSTDTAKTSITSAEAATFKSLTAKLPWGLLAALNLAETDRSVSDDFNRSALGGLYSSASNTGASQLSLDGTRVVFTGTSSGHQNAIHITGMAGDANRVEGDIGLNPFASAGSQEAGFLLHCNRDFSQVVFLGINTGFATVYSGSITSLTQRAQLAGGGSGKWSLYYDLVNDKYVVLKDGLTTGLEWTGVSTAVSHGRDFRYGGFGIEQVSLVTAGIVDNFTLRDWTP